MLSFSKLLEYGRILKNENEYIRENLERLQAFTDEQLKVFNILIEDKTICDVIDGVENEEYAIYDNFYDYIDEYINSLCLDLPSFVKLDYNAMYYSAFEYDDNLYIQWQDWAWCDGMDRYGTDEQRKKYYDYIEYNLQYSKCIDFYG